RHALHVQQDLDHVLLHAFHGGVLVQHAVDAHLGDGGTRHRREQDAPQGVAERITEAARERLERDLGVGRRQRLDIDAARAQKIGGNTLHCCSPQSVTSKRYFEWSATIRLSLMSAGRSERSGADLNTPFMALVSTSSQSGNPRWSAASSAAFTRNCSRRDGAISMTSFGRT